MYRIALKAHFPRVHSLSGRGIVLTSKDWRPEISVTMLKVKDLAFGAVKS
jgi:hypothetical protein